jgi:UDP-2,3-diacylglucosamine hydrolase
MRPTKTSDDGVTDASGATGASPLLIVAAGGALPFHVAEAAQASGRRVFLIGIAGEVDDRIASFPHAVVKWGQFGRLEKIVAETKARDVVLVGAITKRPDFGTIAVDFGTLKVLPGILRSLVGGDDSVLGQVIRVMEGYGLRVRGPHEIATDLVAAAGVVAGPRPAAAELRDAKAALHAAAAIGGLDIGQAAIAVDERVVALEAAEGTDAIIRRVGELRGAARFRWSGRKGVLAKCAKPGQDLRVDMPTIGPRTVELVAEVGLAGIVIEAGRVMIAERARTVAAAARTATFIYAMDFAPAEPDAAR